MKHTIEIQFIAFQCSLLHYCFMNAFCVSSSFSHFSIYPLSCFLIT